MISQFHVCIQTYDIIQPNPIAFFSYHQGGFAGNAGGFKIASLMKLPDTKANKPRMNLMHYIVLLAEEKDKKLLGFPDEMKNLTSAVRYVCDQGCS